MALAIDFYGFRYEDSVPSFVIASDKLVWHRPQGKMLDYPALTALVTDMGYTPGANEIGEADDWLLMHLGIENTGGGVTPPPDPSTSATAGTPGSFDADVPADLTELQGLGALGNTAAWAEGEYVVLGDASEAYWDGSDWVEGRVPAP